MSPNRTNESTNEVSDLENFITVGSFGVRNKLALLMDWPSSSSLWLDKLPALECSMGPDGVTGVSALSAGAMDETGVEHIG